jgi:prepilin-type N-terminal cleavage/methylation domain-containing protein
MTTTSFSVLSSKGGEMAIKRSNHTSYQQRGFTLVEVMVGITILLLVILPLAGLYVKSLAVIQKSAQLSSAVHLAEERLNQIKSLPYWKVEYTNPAFVPGFNYVEVLPNGDRNWVGFGGLPSNSSLPNGNLGVGVRQGNNINVADGAGWMIDAEPDTSFSMGGNRLNTWNVEGLMFDPTYLFQNRGYLPPYRDFYNNWTGQLLDKNYNGVIDDDVNGDGAIDGLDNLLADPNRDGLVGDGLFDTIVEGALLEALDPSYRNIQNTRARYTQERKAPIPDDLLKNDFSQLEAEGLNTILHTQKFKAFENFIRMTTIIDPTPFCGDPYVPGGRYFVNPFDNTAFATQRERLQAFLCLMRDYEPFYGVDALDRRTINEGEVDYEWNNSNNRAPLYGKKVIVTILWVTDGTAAQDIDGDGIPDELAYSSLQTFKREAFLRQEVFDSPELMMLLSIRQPLDTGDGYRAEDNFTPLSDPNVFDGQAARDAVYDFYQEGFFPPRLRIREDSLSIGDCNGQVWRTDSEYDPCSSFDDHDLDEILPYYPAGGTVGNDTILYAICR